MARKELGNPNTKPARKRTPKPEAAKVDVGIPQPAAVYVDPKTLVPWRRNPRRNEHAIDAVEKSIREYGFGAPIVARRADGRVIAGHSRLSAALRMGLGEVPVRFLDVTEAQADALAVADNRTGEIATWDQAQLVTILREFDAPTRSIIGYDDREFERLIAKTNPQPKGLPDDSIKASKLVHSCPRCGHEF